MVASLTTLAQTYSSYYSYDSTSSSNSGLGALFLVYIAFLLVIAVISIVGMWKIFQKAGKPGWAAVVPIYNFIVLLEIVGRPTWFVLLLLAGFIPFVGWIAVLAVSIIVANDLSKSFGRGTGTTVLLVVLPFIGYPMLGFGSATYHGPSVKNGPTAASGTPGAIPPAAPPAAQ
jgi:hypothetical protein